MAGRTGSRGGVGTVQILLVAVLLLSGGDMKAALGYIADAPWFKHFHWPHFIACLPYCLFDAIHNFFNPKPAYPDTPAQRCYDTSYRDCWENIYTRFTDCDAAAIRYCERGGIAKFQKYTGASAAALEDAVIEQFDPIDQY